MYRRIITTPIDRLKILQQSSPPSQPQPSLPSLIRRLGVTGCYRGLSITALRDLGYGPYFGTYELVSRVGLEGEPSAVRKLLAGGCAGIVGWGSTFALDVVKTRIQATQPFALNSQGKLVPSAYGTIRSTVASSYREEGWRVFVRGLGPTLLRSVPVNMVCFATFEAVVGVLHT